MDSIDCLPFFHLLLFLLSNFIFSLTNSHLSLLCREGNAEPCCSKSWPVEYGGWRKRRRRKRGVVRHWPQLRFRWPFASPKRWETQPPSSASPLWTVTRPWPGSCTRATLSSGMVWTQTHRMESSTSTTHPCTMCAATPWHVCSGKSQSHAMQQLSSAVRRAVSHVKLNNN